MESQSGSRRRSTEVAHSTRCMLKFLSRCPVHSLGLPLLHPIEFLDRCDQEGVLVGLMCGKVCDGCTDWLQLMSGSINDEMGPFEGEFAVAHSTPFLQSVGAPGDPSSAALLKLWKTNRALADQRESLIKNYRHGFLAPTTYVNVLWPPGKPSIFQQVNDFVVVLQMRPWPSSGCETHGRPQLKHMLSDGQARIGILTFFEIAGSTTDGRIMTSAVREHTALHHTPAMVTTCTTKGQVLAQNAASRAMLGILGSDHKLSSLPDHLRASLPAAYQTGTDMNYLLELLGSQAAFDEAIQQVEGQGTYRKRVRLHSPWLMAMMRLPPSAERHHEVIITKLKDGITGVPIYLVVQMDMTEFVMTERGVTEAYQHHRELLRELLPDQVTHALLKENQPGTTSSTPAGHHSPARTPPSSSTQIGERAKSCHQLSMMYATEDPRKNSALSRARRVCFDTMALLEQPPPCPVSKPVQRRRSVAALATLAMQANNELEDRLFLSSRDVQQLSTFHPFVSVLFTEIEGFTDIVQKLHPGQVMLFLNDLFSEIDLLVEEYDVYKVETVRDSYMVCSGLFDRSSQQVSQPDALAGAGAAGQPGNEEQARTSDAPTICEQQNILGGHDPQHASKMIDFARALLRVSSFVHTPLGAPVQLHVGIHTGPIMTGVVGRKLPRFCCFGDTVNTASRMMTTAQPGAIQATAAFRDLTPQQPWQPTGGVHVKGKGQMETFMLK